MTENAPNPGSPTALVAGCTCPVGDNHHGAGVVYYGAVMFWYTADCPVHCPRAEDDSVEPETGNEGSGE